jgi:hypothetical protein
MTNLEKALVQSLHAKVSGIQPDSLTYPDWQPDRMIGFSSGITNRSALRRLAPAFAAVIVLAVVGTVVVVGVALRSRSHGANSASTPLTVGIVGYRWRLLHIDHDGQRTTVPASLTPSVEFGADHWISIYDTVNRISGTFTLVPGGYSTSGLVTTLVGASDNDRIRGTIIKDINTLALAQTVTAHLAAPSSTTGKETLQLIVPSAALTFTFQKDGLAKSQPISNGPTPIRRST